MSEVLDRHDSTRAPGIASARTVLARYWPVGVSIVLALGVYRMGVTVFVAVSAAIAASFLAYRFRLSAVLALLLSVLIPQLALTVDLLPDNWDALGGGVRIADLILVGMWGASAALLVSRRHRFRSENIFIGISLGLAALLFVAVARNWSAYGLSALGEFRFRYLILGLPVFLALGLDSPRSRLLAARLLAWAPVVGVSVMLPVVGALRGWGLGEASRFYPSAISLALLLAAIWIGLSSEGSHGGVAPGLAYGAFTLIALVILKDAHRSVWLVAGVSLLMLVWLRVIKIQRLWVWAPLALIGGTLVIVLSASGANPVDYVVARGQAFLDPASDPTSNWRLMVWKAYSAVLRNNPLFGQGFGGYWDVYVPEFGARVITSPHSMYAQTLVKTGLVGMLALLGWFAVSLRALVRSRSQIVPIARPGQEMIVLGVVAIGASLAYGTVYALEFWPLAWMGLALAEKFRGEAAMIT